MKKATIAIGAAVVLNAVMAAAIARHDPRSSWVGFWVSYYDCAGERKATPRCARIIAAGDARSDRPTDHGITRYAEFVSLALVSMPPVAAQALLARELAVVKAWLDSAEVEREKAMRGVSVGEAYAPVRGR
jgi:hypothetical protein